MIYCMEQKHLRGTYVILISIKGDESKTDRITFFLDESWKQIYIILIYAMLCMNYNQQR